MPVLLKSRRHQPFITFSINHSFCGPSIICSSKCRIECIYELFLIEALILCWLLNDRDSLRLQVQFARSSLHALILYRKNERTLIVTVNRPPRLLALPRPNPSRIHSELEMKVGNQLEGGHRTNSNSFRAQPMAIVLHRASSVAVTLFQASSDTACNGQNLSTNSTQSILNISIQLNKWVVYPRTVELLLCETASRTIKSLQTMPIWILTKKKQTKPRM